MATFAYHQEISFKGRLPDQAATLAHHLAGRFDTGNSLVISLSSEELTKQLVKSWQKLFNDLQQKRDHAVDADQKLRLTRRIIKMQSMKIGNDPSSNLRIVDYLMLRQLALDNQFKTVYVLGRPNTLALREFIQTQAGYPLLVGSDLADLSDILKPKKVLDNLAETAWHELHIFLEEHGIYIKALARADGLRMPLLNTALEKLLDEQTAVEYIAFVNKFNQAARTAMPLNWSKERVAEQQTLAVLANQISSFSAGLQHQPMIPGEDPVFFLNDVARISVQPQSTIWGLALNNNIACQPTNLCWAY